jgi:LmbE family N-acetylglucosaminyl deacetylase
MLNKKVILIVAPHADDETLGCGGIILRNIAAGAEVHWLIITSMKEEYGYTQEQVATRKNEIASAAKSYNFTQVHEIGYQPAFLDTKPKGDIIGSISKVVNSVRPEEVYTVFRNDAHSDHEVVYDAVMSATKSFRYPFIKRVLAYETLSETDFGMKPEDGGFKPNVFVDISGHLEQKLDILEIFESEVREFPFPRSRIALESLARVRGAQSNLLAAEAFMLMKEVI